MVAAAGSKDAPPLVCRDVLEALGPDGYLINIARGSVVDEAGPRGAVGSRTARRGRARRRCPRTGCAATLREMDNVVVLPHVGSATARTRADDRADPPQS